MRCLYKGFGTIKYYCLGICVEFSPKMQTLFSTPEQKAFKLTKWYFLGQPRNFFLSFPLLPLPYS